MEALKYEVVVSGFGLVEAPRVDERGNIYFTDISGGGVHRAAPGGQPETLVPTTRKSVGGMAFTHDGGLILSGPSVAYWDSKTGKLTDLLKTYPGKLTHGFNDLTVDSMGSVLVGSTNTRPTMGPNGLNETDPGDLYRIDPDGKVTVVWEGGLELSNGMGFSPDGKTLYHVDAFAKVIFAYDVASDRRLTARRVFARFEEGWGWPDGMAVDAEGGVWSPALFGGMIIRFRSDGTSRSQVRGADQEARHPGLRRERHVRPLRRVRQGRRKARRDLQDPHRRCGPAGSQVQNFTAGVRRSKPLFLYMGAV